MALADCDFCGNVVTDALHFESALQHLSELKKKDSMCACPAHG
jgi:hypothetical protein